jgi:hypothetical protein
MEVGVVSLPTLIYCGGGNSRFARIALETGYKYGAQMPKTVYGPVYFADQNWRKPNRVVYMAALQTHRPVMATVLDWEREEQLAEVLDWAEEAAQYVERVLIVPKVIGGIGRIPRHVNGKDVVLAYSVPSRYAGTQVPAWEFAGWPVHLLGGSPHAQMRLYRHLAGVCEVVSADGSMTSKMATTRCQYWVNGTATESRDRFWPGLKGWTRGDGPDEAFRRSCVNIVTAWQQLERKAA